jgi:putative ABC transport system permease protein
MLMHDLWLALHGLRRTPVLSLLMIGAIAVGIAAAMIAITLYHGRAGHPIPWKNDTLYAVALDARSNARPQRPGRHPEYPPFQLTYRDAIALYASRIPVHAVMMYRAAQIVTPGRAGLQPFGVSARVATADFFATFDVPFLYGAGWSRAEDDQPSPVVVLSRFLNQTLFSGANSVGREVILDGHAYRVAGVLASWMPQPRYYDLESGRGFDVPEDVFLPFGWMRERHLTPNGSVLCMGPPGPARDFLETLLTQECAWLQYWVELRGRADRDRYQTFVNSYTDEQRSHGRFPRPNNNRIVDVPTWLQMHDVVGDDSRLQLVLGLVFLAICVLNTLGLMLARSIAAAPVYALRRALGARRADIIRQHVIEVVLVGLLGGAAGVALTAGGLSVLKGLLFSDLIDSIPGAGPDNPDRVGLVQSLVHMDTTVLAVALGLSILTSLLVGLYPAWRAGRLEPAGFLKAQ